ncbi:MAG: hypothetical protein WCJ29_04675 [bacterium]
MNEQESFATKSEAESFNKIMKRAEQMKADTPEKHMPEVIDNFVEYVALRRLLDYKDPKDSRGLPEDVREFMEKRGLEGHDYLVGASNEWMEQFEPFYDMQDQYMDWSIVELEQLIKALK